jgi:triacylglycerol lipase
VTERETALQVYRCAVAAGLAYLDRGELHSQAAEARFALVAAIQRGSHNALVLDDDGVRLIAFRGTDERKDWLTNLDVWFRSTSWGRVHRGFQDAVTTFWPEVDDHVRVGITAGRRIWLTGHSLGGALALLAAARLAANDVIADRLCTFGQPAVGGAAFCRQCGTSFGTRYIRCVNHTDAVADDLTFWRQHSGTLWYFDVDGVLHHTVTFRRGLIDHVMAPHRFGGLSQFSAHGMAKYLPLLRAIAEPEP